MRLLGAYSEARFRAKLVIGLAVLGAAGGALTWAGWIFGWDADRPALDYLRAIWRAMTLPDARAHGLDKEVLASAAIGALVLVLPVVVFFLKSSSKKGA